MLTHERLCCDVPVQSNLNKWIGRTRWSQQVSKQRQADWVTTEKDRLKTKIGLAQEQHGSWR